MEIIFCMALVCLIVFMVGYWFGVDCGKRKMIKKMSIPDYDYNNPINGCSQSLSEIEIGIDGRTYCRMMPVNDWRE